MFWLVPTIGLFLVVLAVEHRQQRVRLVDGFTTPAQLTIDNYANLLGNSQFMGSFVNTIAITLPATVLVVIIGALAGYAFAWMEFPGRDWLLVVVIVLLAVPLQVSLIPIAKLYGSIGLFGSIVGVVIFHVAYGLPFAIFLLRNFFTQMPGRDARGGPHGRGERVAHLQPDRAAARAAGDREPGDLPVPVDLERHARRADLHQRRRRSR